MSKKPGVIARFCHLLVLLALAAMPLGMAPAAASAAATGHHATTPMAPGHCDDAGEGGETEQGAAVHCAVGCSALAATAAADPEPVDIAGSVTGVPAVMAFVGRQPEADPPPPKLA